MNFRGRDLPDIALLFSENLNKEAPPPPNWMVHVHIALPWLDGKLMDVLEIDGLHNFIELDFALLSGKLEFDEHVFFFGCYCTQIVSCSRVCRDAGFRVVDMFEKRMAFCLQFSFCEEESSLQ